MQSLKVKDIFDFQNFNHNQMQLAIVQLYVVLVVHSFQLVENHSAPINDKLKGRFSKTPIRKK